MIDSLLIVSYEEVTSWNGLNSRIEGIAKALLGKGVSVEIAAPFYSKKKLGGSYICGIQNHQIPVVNFFGKIKVPIISRILFVIFFSYGVLQYFRKKGCKFGYVQSEQIYTFWPSFILARKWGAKLILDDPAMLGYFVDEKLKRTGPIRWLLKKLVLRFELLIYRLPDYVFCSSRRTFDYIFAKVKREGSRLYYLPNGVNTTKYSDLKKKKRGSNIFFNCSLPYYQNTAALRNISDILKYFNEKQFYEYLITIIVNDMTLLPHELFYVFKNNAKVRLLSNVDSLVPYIQDADVVILPYGRGHFLTAGGRLKVMEALSCGKVILTTPEGIDGVEGCINEENVILCNDCADMANKLLGLFKNMDGNAKFIERIQLGARNLATKYYDWKQLVEIYDEIER